MRIYIGSMGEESSLQLIRGGILAHPPAVDKDIRSLTRSSREMSAQNLSKSNGRLFLDVLFILSPIAHSGHETHDKHDAVKRETPIRSIDSSCPESYTKTCER